MFPLATDLMGLGIAAGPASRLGLSPTTAAGAGTAQATATAIAAGTLVTATTAGGQTAFRLPGGNPGDQLLLRNSSSTAALVFPPTGGTINAAAANASVSVAENLARAFVCVSPGVYISFLTA